MKHDKLTKSLKKTNVDKKDIRCIEKLYWYQTAYITTQNITSEDIQIRRGVRQKCVLSPLLCNLNSEKIFNEAFEDRHMGIKVNGVPISNLRYTDVTVLIANDIEELQEMFNI